MLVSESLRPCPDVHFKLHKTPVSDHQADHPDHDDHRTTLCTILILFYGTVFKV